MGDVRPLYKVNSHAVLAEDKAQYLERLAGEIRSGEIPVSKAVLVVMAEGEVNYFPFGEPCNCAELVGILEFAKREMIG
jgi:hypothetical protein